jgi:hypothetical protein
VTRSEDLEGGQAFLASRHEPLTPDGRRTAAHSFGAALEASASGRRRKGRQRRMPPVFAVEDATNQQAGSARWRLPASRHRRCVSLRHSSERVAEVVESYPAASQARWTNSDRSAGSAPRGLGLRDARRAREPS